MKRKAITNIKCILKVYKMLDYFNIIQKKHWFTSPKNGVIRHVGKKRSMTQV